MDKTASLSTLEKIFNLSYTVPMKGLLLDTSTHTLFIGVTEKNNLISTVALEGGKNSSKTLFPYLKNHCPLQEFSYIAFGVGPGSYMGLRTGATIAQTLAYGRNLPLLTFPSPLLYLPEQTQGPFSFIGKSGLGNYLIEGEVKGGIPFIFSLPRLLSAQNTEHPTSIKHVSPHLKWVASYCDFHSTQKLFTHQSEIELAYLH